MARKKPHEEHENHERYLVTYSDLITLLLAFFIILYALSSVDEDKYDAFSHSLSLEFNSGSPAVIDFEGGTYNKNARQEVGQQELLEMRRAVDDVQLQTKKQEIDRYLKENNLQDKISTKLDDDGLHIIVTNEILFNSGEAKLKTDIQDVLKSITFFIQDMPNPVVINGHTDNVPIATSAFPSNWELSTARAVTVLKEMLEANKRINPSNLSAAGYGEYQPIADNATEDGKQKNRRVDILIKRMTVNVNE